jgi:hypothetical protein
MMSISEVEMTNHLVLLVKTFIQCRSIQNY